MANYLVTDTQLTNVANAIREKNHSAATLAFPTDFITEISKDIQPKWANFFDYDGTLVASYTKEEVAELTALPPNPVHTNMGLTAQGWNWTLEQLKTALNYRYPEVVVGQVYITTSGNTEIDIELTDANLLSPYFCFFLGGPTTIFIDWGDENITNMTADSYGSISTQHVYSSIGSYTITFYTEDNTECVLVGAYKCGSILSEINQISYPITYSRFIKAIRLGNYTRISTYGLSELPNLEYITIPNTVTTIGVSSFFLSNKIKCLIFPPGITSIPTSLCEYCETLEIVSLPPTLTELKSGAFSNTTLGHITIPEGVTAIAGYTFYNCKQFQQLICPSTVTDYSGSNICNNTKNLMVVDLSQSTITSLGVSSFNNNYCLQTILLPSTLTTIGQYCFMNCASLKEITLPASVTTLGDSPFSDCYSLTRVNILATTPPTLSNIGFSNVPASFRIYVPYSSDHSVLAAYKAETNWSTWADFIVEMEAPSND